MRASARPSALRQVEVELALTAVADAESIEHLRRGAGGRGEADLAGEYKLEPDAGEEPPCPTADLMRDHAPEKGQLSW